MASDFVYGVFKSHKELEGAMTELAGKGLKAAPAGFVKDGDVLLRATIDTEPVKRWFFKAGILGAIVGGISGAIATPTVPYTDTYQILTPLMSMITGAVFFSYFGCWVFGFLNGLETAELDEGVTIENKTGEAFVLVARPENRENKLAAIECFEGNGATGILVRSGELGPMEAVSSTEFKQESKVELPQATAVQLAA